MGAQDIGWAALQVNKLIKILMARIAEGASPIGRAPESLKGEQRGRKLGRGPSLESVPSPQDLIASPGAQPVNKDQTLAFFSPHSSYLRLRGSLYIV
jgi:hypothetical protein